MIIYKEEARQKIALGVKKLADAVRVTMGPMGRNVILEKEFASPVVTNDGVTIAKAIEFEDRYEDMGAQLAKDVASKTNDLAGDGTSTATILADAIITEGLKNLAAGANPMELKNEIMEAIDVVAKELDKMALPIDTIDKIKQIATISAQNEEVGDIIAKIFKKISKDGVITVEEGQKNGLTYEVVTGMEVANGYISPYFATNQEDMTATIKDARFLLTNIELKSPQQIAPIVEKLTEKGIKNLVIIAPGMSNDVIGTLVTNKLRGAFEFLAINAPGVGENAKEILKDIAAVTGGRFIADDSGEKIEELTIKDLGVAKTVFSTNKKTIITDGASNKGEVKARVKDISEKIETARDIHLKTVLGRRKASLSGGVGVIKVGAMTSVELIEKKHRIEDAILATKAASEDGIVAGGGTALLRCKKALNQSTGASIVSRAIELPCRQIAENAGHDGGVIIHAVLSSDKGFNAKTGEMEDLIKSGVIDPVKVTKTALWNAASIASTFLTTEAAILIKKQEDDS